MVVTKSLLNLQFWDPRMLYEVCITTSIQWLLAILLWKPSNIAVLFAVIILEYHKDIFQRALEPW